MSYSQIITSVYQSIRGSVQGEHLMKNLVFVCFIFLTSYMYIVASHEKVQQVLWKTVTCFTREKIPFICGLGLHIPKRSENKNSVKSSVSPVCIMLQNRAKPVN